ncbi:MAG: DNA-3-methyladenine glycosylase [Planctomycetota bacterium]
MNEILDHDFFAHEPMWVAKNLLGKILVSTIGGKKTSGIIVETEAYLSSGDPACHGARGRTKSNASMFEQAGLAYVYPIHAKYCFNITTESEGMPSAVLIRAIEPTLNLPTMRMRRKQESVLQLCSGPGKLCQALGFNRSIDGINLTRRKKVWIEQNRSKIQPIKFFQTERIGVTSAKEMKLRFVIQGHRFASGPKRLR